MQLHDVYISNYLTCTSATTWRVHLQLHDVYISNYMTSTYAITKPVHLQLHDMYIWNYISAYLTFSNNAMYVELLISDQNGEFIPSFVSKSRRARFWYLTERLKSSKNLNLLTELLCFIRKIGSNNVWTEFPDVSQLRASQTQWTAKREWRQWRRWERVRCDVRTS